MCGIYSLFVQPKNFELLHRRLRRAFQKSSEHFLGFDGRRQFIWGYETQRSGDSYDWKGRQLLADAKLLHTFAPQAHNQIAILRAFQQRRWSHEIVDPLGNAADLDYAKRLRDAAYGLNAAQGVIFFSTTASLRKIRWDYLGKEEWLLIPRTS